MHRTVGDEKVLTYQCTHNGFVMPKEATAMFFCRALFLVRGTTFEQIPPKLVEVTHFQNEKKSEFEFFSIKLSPNGLLSPILVKFAQKLYVSP